MGKKIGKIDVHHHILPQEYLSELSKIGIKNAAGVPFPDWDVEKTIAYMDRQNISTAITSISSLGVYFGDSSFTKDLARKCNDFSASLIEKHPQRFGAFAVLPLPDVNDSLEEIEYALDMLKLDGVSLLSNVDGKYLGDPDFQEIYSELNRRKSVVFIHPNAPPEDKMPLGKSRAAALEFVFDTTRAVANMISNATLKRNSDIKFILSHAGGTVPYLTWRMSFGKTRVIKQLKNLFYDTALSATSYVFPSLLELVDISQILFGTDFPFLPERLIIELIKNFEDYQDFDTYARLNIERENILTLFPRLNQFI